MQSQTENQNWATPLLTVATEASWLSAHNRAVTCAAKLKAAYRDLLEVLIEIDAHQFYFQLEKPDLYAYCLESLNLPNHTAHDFVNVIRTSRFVPQLAQAILTGKTTVSKARRICSVITPANQAEWIALVCECPLPLIKKAVAMANPRAAVEESMNYVSGEVLQIKFAVSEEWAELWTQTKNLLAQKYKRAVSTEEALFILMSDFTAKNDPLKKAERAVLRRKRKSTDTNETGRASDSNDPNAARSSDEVSTRSRYRPASVEHEVHLRDGGQCSHVDQEGTRCRQRRWLHKHHIVEFSNGGGHTLENLETLCSGHHRMKHAVRH